MAASFYESLEEKSSRLFFLLGDGCWVLGVDEVLEGQKRGSRYLVGIGIYFGKPKKKETFIYNSS